MLSIEPKIVPIFLAHSSISSQHTSFWSRFLTRNLFAMYHSKNRCPTKKSDHMRPTHLTSYVNPTHSQTAAMLYLVHITLKNKISQKVNSCTPCMSYTNCKLKRAMHLPPALKNAITFTQPIITRNRKWECIHCAKPHKFNPKSWIEYEEYHHCGY